MEEEIDIDWFLKQEKIEKKYDMFYKANVKSIKLTIFYVKDNNIIYTKQSIENLTNNRLYKKQLFDCIKNNRVLNKEIFSLHDLLKYNISISPHEVFKNKISLSYAKILHSTGDIYFEDTIPFFSSLNELFIILKPKKLILTKKIKLFNKKTKRRSLQ